MKVKVKFFAIIREVAGVKELDVEVEEGTSILNLLNILARKLPPKFGEYVLEEGGAISRFLIVLVNGKGISELKGLET
ncbi:MAG: MoaD/ThiS family protein, partial [Thermoproteota archaeon]